ncbi:WxL domain-containing protein [Enterococcus faecium]|uniref:WxL domain-containing protein n=1 Tax=Enterococcus faecium TaxID=1352 RepID=UPI0039A6797A
MKSIRLLGATLLASTTLLGAGQAFAASTSTNADPASTQTPIQATLSLPTNGGTNPTPPSPVDPSHPTDPDNPGNKPNNPGGTFGIAYQPDVFNFGTHELAESGLQSFAAQLPTSGDRAFHVGVKDKTREQKGWTLQATLEGSISQQPGISILVGNGSGEVKENDGTSLVAAPVGAVTGRSDVEITTSVAEVMSGSDSFTHNSVYDYQLGTPTLKIADAKQVAANTYSGNVNWNLSVAP